MKINWSILFLCVTICGALLTAFGAVASYILLKQDQKQKDAIQSLGTENLKLAEEIKTLSALNNNISQRIVEMEGMNKLVSDKNLDLSKQSNQLINEVQHLTTQSKELVTKVDLRTSYEAAENLATGELLLNFAPNFSPTEDFNLELGMKLAIPTSRILAGDIFKQILPGLKFEPIRIEIKDGKLVLSLKIFDIDGNLIAEVKDNYWRPNRNFYGRFNYDDNGFEVIDNQGNVAVNIDVVAKNRVSIQGVFRSSLQKIMVVSSNRTFEVLPYRDFENEKDFKKNNGKEYNQRVSELVLSIKPLFEYFGKDWLHKRINKPRIIPSNSYFDPNGHIYEVRPESHLKIGFNNISIPYKGVNYEANISLVDGRLPNRVLFRIKDWREKGSFDMMMAEQTGGKNGDMWQNSKPMDIDDLDFIKAAINTLIKYIKDNNLQ